MLLNLRYAVRLLLKNPAFSAIAILTLAIGIGANTAIFTVSNALLLRPLPYGDPSRIVLLSGATFDAQGSWGRLSLPFFNVVEQQNHSYSAVAASIFDSFNLTGHGDPEQISAARVSWKFFDALGVAPIAGRSFTKEEDQPGGKPVVILSYKLASRLFPDASNAVGQSVTLNGEDHTIIGVLSPRFVFGLFGGERDIWAPRVVDMSGITPTRANLGGPYFNLIGRLRPGVSIDQAEAELRVLYEQYKRSYPGNFDATLNLQMRVANIQDELVANIRPALLIFSAAVGLVLLIACANVASLLLSRAIGRKKEFAVRAALGASRRTLIGQLLTESVLMALLAGALGIAIGQGATRLLPSFDNQGLTLGDLGIDWKILAFTLAISVFSGILFGLAPAVHLASGVNSGLREESRGSTQNRSRSRAKNALVIVQVALSVVLLVASGLLIHSFLRLRNAPPGFDPKNLLTMRINLAPAKYSNAAKNIEFYRDAIQRLQTIPGVEAVTFSTALPTNATHSTPVLFEGQPALALGKRPIVDIQQITPDYTRVMRVPLLKGRIFTDRDDERAPMVALVNLTAVRRFWPNDNPIGKRVWIGTMKNPFEVIGVLGDTKNNGPAAPTEAEIFMPLTQMISPYISLTLRSSIDLRSLASSVRTALATVDRDQPVTGVSTMEEFLDTQSQQSRFATVLLGAFSGVAFLLAAIGIYGVIAYSVAQRTQELGIRIALGARSADILRLVISSGLALAAAGIAIGIAVSFAATRLMTSLLFETSATDPLAFVSSAALFVAVALLASYLPARRAIRVDPAQALRAE